MASIYPEDDRELAAMCGTWQQLDILKRRRDARNAGTIEKKQLAEMTRSERKLWYRNNIEAVQQEKEDLGYCSNYRQFELMQGAGSSNLDVDEETRSRRLTWFRNGGSNQIDEERELAGRCSNWRQFHLLTRGPELRMKQKLEDAEMAEEPEPTRSERLLWYRHGGEQVVDESKWLASNSENWVQYKLTRDARKHTEDLYDAVQARYSNYDSKIELSNHMLEETQEGIRERNLIRAGARSRNVTDSITKDAYQCYLQPFEVSDMEEAAKLSTLSKMRKEMLEEKLRMTTESVMTSRTRYSQSARELAFQAIQEDQEEMAASRTKRRTTFVQQNQTISSAA